MRGLGGRQQQVILRLFVGSEQQLKGNCGFRVESLYEESEHHGGKSDP